MNATQKRTAKKTSASKDKSYEGFTEDERGAMKERAKELKAASRGADDETALLEKIAELPESDRAIAERLHAIITANAPELSPKLWYGMPGYAKDGKIVCFFQNAGKFKARYNTFGFNDSAMLDDGDMWPTAYAVTKLTPAVEKQIIALVKKAVS
jgi:uncharacterized protein YdhG (YjbR/CyaY superfamily)